MQSGPQTMHSGNGMPEYPSLNSHGAASSLINPIPHQFSEEEQDIIVQKDKIFKKVNDLFNMLKQGEDEAQV